MPDSFRRRLLALAVGAACAVAAPTSSRADRPTTAPAGERTRQHEGSDSGRQGHDDRRRHDERDRHDDSNRHDDRDRRGQRGDEQRSDDGKDKGIGNGKDRGDGKSRRSSSEVSEEEWNEIRAFMREYSRKKWDMFEKIPEGHELRRKVKPGIVYRYRELQTLKAQDPSRYELGLRRVRLEDDLFGLMGQLKFGRDELSEEKQRAMLRPKFVELWKIQMEDRELQVPRILQQLRDLRLNDAAVALEKEMEEDKAPEQEEQWVERRVSDFLGQLKGGRPNFGRGGPRGPRGDGGPPR
jgi:hypothetical protein